MISRVVARTRMQARLWLAEDGSFVTANRKHLAASFATIEAAEDAIRRHVHPTHYDRWEVAPDWRPEPMPIRHHGGSFQTWKEAAEYWFRSREHEVECGLQIGADRARIQLRATQERIRADQLQKHITAAVPWMSESARYLDVALKELLDRPTKTDSDRIVIGLGNPRSSRRDGRRVEAQGMNRKPIPESAWRPYSKLPTGRRGPVCQKRGAQEWEAGPEEPFNALGPFVPLRCAKCKTDTRDWRKAV